jgi:hypothetical protein
MIKAELANEFTTVDLETKKPTAEHEARELAFHDFNKLVRENPEHVVRVMGIMAMEAEPRKGDGVVVNAAERVLSATNNGSQIGFDEKSRERIWGEIFEDPWHYNATRDYNRARLENGSDSDEAQRLSRLRGFYTLCAFAEQQIVETPQQLEAAA